MNNLKPCLGLSAIFMIFLFTACKKNRPLEKEAPLQKEPESVFVPIRFETQGLSLSFRYKENSNLLTAVEGSDGNKTLISYTGQKPSKLEKFKNGNLYQSVFYEHDNTQRVNRAVLFGYDHILDGYIPEGDYVLQYNSNNLPAEIKYHNAGNLTVKSQSMTYHSSGNPASASITHYPGQTSTITYTFDDQKGIARYISCNRLLALEMEDWFLSSALNNILTYNNSAPQAEQLSFSYVYNAEGYPSKMSISRGKNVQQINISYKEISLASVQ